MVDWKNSPDLSTPLDADHLTAAFADERASERAYQSSTYGALASFAPSAVTQLTIPTYDGSGQATHPSVIDLGGSPVSGYRYWMAFTPYPGADSTKENPSIVASNDMATWVVPAGVTNPLVAAPASPFFNSDTHLIFWSSKFWLYYRTSGTGMNDRFSVITSTDGITWAAPIIVAQTASSWSSVSPAFRVVDGRVVCWFVVSYGGPTVYPTDLFTMESLDGVTFRNTRKCTVTLPAGATAWHIDVDYGTTATGEPMYLLAATAFVSSSACSSAPTKRRGPPPTSVTPISPPPGGRCNRRSPLYA